MYEVMFLALQTLITLSLRPQFIQGVMKGTGEDKIYDQLGINQLPEADNPNIPT